MTSVSRRAFLTTALATPLALRASRLLAAESSSGVTFSFGTYGMPKMTTEDALRTIQRLGYDGVEICVRPEWDSAPEKLSPSRREAIRTLLEDQGLALTALMVHQYPSGDDAEHAAVLERLRAAARLGHDLSPAAPPLLQTVLGGGEWEQQKTMFADRLADWVRVADETDTVIAIKPHRGGGMSRPEEAVWLIEQLGKPRQLRLVYDYSHYAYRDMPLEATVRTALPYMAHIAIKDAVQTGTKVGFALPGEAGTFDYAALFRLLKAGGYTGDICCEVSSMVSNRADYDPTAAAEMCYKNIAPAFESSGLARRQA